MEDINHALVEEKRPPIYTAMKYWGKKPHNIWREYIEKYTPENGVYLDPFAGSGISLFEAFKANRRAIGFDLNPLTSFNIEVMSSKFDKKAFKEIFKKIFKSVEEDKTYIEYFTSNSRRHPSKKEIVQSLKWNNGIIYEIALIDSSKKKPQKYLVLPEAYDHQLGNSMSNINIPYWFPVKTFPNSPSFSSSFITSLGGNSFADLWSKRTLYVLSRIFDEILAVGDEILKKQLLFGFIQCVHLCTKMSVPRREQARRPFSTSWGRSAYICAVRQMEMNPLLVFESSCLGKQSVESCLSNAEKYLGGLPKIKNVSISNKSKNVVSGFDIKYGVVDINTLEDYVKPGSIDFIITDPPYGGLVQYLDLSTIWLCWLEKYDSKYNPNYAAEITIKKNVIPLDIYKQRFTNGIRQLYKVLKDDGKIVFTFHNKDISIWNAFLNSISIAGFKIEKVIHQQNRRTGESNVANPYGTSATDFYIRCIKSQTTPIKTDKDEFEHFVLVKAIRIIAERNEPTPYQILFNGLLSDISTAGFDLEDFDTNLERILSKEVGNTFIITKNEVNNAGAYWWFAEPGKHIKYPDKKLSHRVEDTISLFLRRKVSVSFDEILAEIFIKYPNGLTPEIQSISKLLNKYATKTGGKWLYKRDITEKDFTKHTEILYNLSIIGKKLGYKIYIGKREQPEDYNGKKLVEFADLRDLSLLSGYIKEQIKRIEMIDMLWINKDNKIEFAIEVENSTNFTSGIQRASNIEPEIPKLMVIPDGREQELKNTTDLLFTDSFAKYSWKYINYTEITRLLSNRNLISTNLTDRLQCL